MSNEAALELIKDFAKNMKRQADSHALMGELGMPFCIMFLDEWAAAAGPFMRSSHRGELAVLIREIDASLRRNRIGLIGPGTFNAAPENPLWQRILSYAEPTTPAATAERPAAKEIYHSPHLSL